MEFIISFLSEWGYLALFICMALENMNIPIPSEIILGFAGFLVSQEIGRASCRERVSIDV